MTQQSRLNMDSADTFFPFNNSKETPTWLSSLMELETFRDEEPDYIQWVLSLSRKGLGNSLFQTAVSFGLPTTSYFPVCI